MKSYKRLFHRLLVMLAFTTLWSCLEYNITTQVMPDGRLLRTITVRGDSADIFTGSYRVPSDSSWIITTRLEQRHEKDIDEGKLFVYEARKEFKNADDLNRTFFKDTSFNDHISIKVNLEKKYRWFYKYYYYTETYSTLFPFKTVPVDRYLSATELRIYLAGDEDVYYAPQLDRILFVTDTLNLPRLTKADSLRYKALRDSIDRKFETWQKINIYNDFYNLVTDALDKISIPVDTVGDRNSFFAWLDTVKTIEKGLENNDAFLDAAAIYFDADAEALKAADPEGFDAFNRKFRVAAFSLETYTSNILMPGVIVSSNAGKVDVNMAVWTFKTHSFYASDYEMNVVSRVINRWVVIGAGLLLIVLIGLGLVPVFRK